MGVLLVFVLVAVKGSCGWADLICDCLWGPGEAFADVLVLAH